MSITFLTATEIADILKISKALAYRLIAQGEIPSFRYGRVSRVRQEDLDAFIQQRMRRPETAETEETLPDNQPEKGDVQRDA